jgi:hypothetical protein
VGRSVEVGGRSFDELGLCGRGAAGPAARARTTSRFFN